MQFLKCVEGVEKLEEKGNWGLYKSSVENEDIQVMEMFYEMACFVSYLNSCLGLGNVHIQKEVRRIEPIAPAWKRAGERDIAWQKALCPF